MLSATADRIVSTSRDAGIDVMLPLAEQSHFARAIAAGHGDNGRTSLVEILRARPRGPVGTMAER